MAIPTRKIRAGCERWGYLHGLVQDHNLYILERVAADGICDCDGWPGYRWAAGCCDAACLELDREILLADVGASVVHVGYNIAIFEIRR